MTIEANQGPLISFGAPPIGTAAGQPPRMDSNPDNGPCAWRFGDMLLDPRYPWTYLPGEDSTSTIFGWPTASAIPIIDSVPSTASATNIAAAQVPVAGTPMTLVSSSGGGVGVGCSFQNSNGVTVTGALGLDVSLARTFTGTFTNALAKITYASVNGLGVQVNDQVTLTSSGTLPTPFALLTTYYIAAISATMLTLAATPSGPPIVATSAGSGTQTVNVTATGSYYSLPFPFTPPVSFGTGAQGFGQGKGGPMRFWNPAWALSRTLILTSVGNDSTGTATVAGYDIYGFPMTQTVTLSNATTVSTTKAFKYITSITPAGTLSGSNLSVGTNDVFGLPLRGDFATQLVVYNNNALIAPSAATFVAADISPPSATTGDVRGTYGSGVASDGTKRLTILWNPLAANMNTVIGLLGQTQA